MRAISQAIDRFCEKHRKFGIPGLMRYIVFISAAVFVISMLDTQGTLRLVLNFSPDHILRGEVWRLITWVFIPFANHPFFTVIMLYFYYYVGTTLEREWGTGKFNIYYIFGMLLNIVSGFILRYVIGLPSILFLAGTINPLYLNLSLFFAFAALYPNQTIRLFFVIPIKIKWAALINAAFFGWSIIEPIIGGNFVLALIPVISLLNFFLICGDSLVSNLRPLKAQGKSQFSDYKKTATKTKRDTDSKPYRHKCAVCGKTDTEYPDMEFRYCSRCEGFHCFCIDHINSHVHFQEK